MKTLRAQVVLVSTLVAITCLSASAQNSVLYWNSVAVDTAVRAKSTPGQTGIFSAYPALAAFDALDAIHPRFHAYGGVTPPASADASEPAAVAAAYHDVLVHYFPSQAASDPSAMPPFIGLDELYSNFLAALSDSGSAISEGIEVGRQAAAGLIALRANDGVFGVSTYVFQPFGPGVYQPTPPFPYPGPQTPWIANMTPFTMENPAQFLPKQGPSPLSSKEWADDYNRTKTWGALLNSPRTAAETTIGLFWVPNAGPMYSGMTASLARSHGLNTLDSARLFAMLWTGYADAVIGCLNAKYHYNFWRPVTAIQNGDIDGNPETEADPNWLPLSPTPNHPEYPAAHGCVTSAVVNVIASYFGTPNLNLSVTTTYLVPAALGGGTVTATRHFSSTNQLLAEVEKARIYGGMHFQHSVVQGAVLGKNIAHHLVAHYFQPLE